MLSSKHVRTRIHLVRPLLGATGTLQLRFLALTFIQVPGVQGRFHAVHDGSANEEEGGEHAKKARVTDQDKWISPINEEVEEEMLKGEEDPGENHIQATIVEDKYQMICGDAESVHKCLNEHKDKIQVVSCQCWRREEAHRSTRSMISCWQQDQPHQQEDQERNRQHDLHG